MVHFIQVGFLLICSVFSLYGQTDARSQKIMDEVVDKFKSYAGVQVDFSLTITNLQDNSEEEQKGKIWLKNEKYKLELPDNILFFDGTKLYQYYPDVNEVNINQPDLEEVNDDEDIQLLHPQTIFNLSSKKFKSNLVKESTQYNRPVYEIDLYPVQLKTTKYSRIRLYIERNKLQIVYLKAFLKDGTQYTITFSPYNVTNALPDTFFTFDKSKHPGVEIIDLTL
ncbi:MAG: outer membrane lipoprotein carrier protein LolA [Bacteroidales bacterium]|jgi:outer membrane lipoprotein-sorting protein|nr:outer membrane lipoprotein carrier protein LolA [Bacteroidales bacterium]